VITFHTSSDGSDESKVDTVVITDDSGTPVLTTGVLTITGVSTANANMYYCKATWGDASVMSTGAYLTVLKIESDTMETIAWGVTDLLATFKCESGAMLLKNADGDAYLDSDGDKVYAAATIAWKYQDADSAWVDASDAK